jgi:methylglutamate dehydrogenase subunit D
MLERISALANARPYVSSRLSIAERPGFTLTQVADLGADFETRLTAMLGPLPQKVAVAQVNGSHTIFRIGPSQFWLVGPETDVTAAMLQNICAVTPLSHSRVRISLSGTPARSVLAKLAPIDFHWSAFTPASVALTGIHHTPVTVHCTGEDAFDIFVMRSFAMNLWEVVTDAAREFC